MPTIFYRLLLILPALASLGLAGCVSPKAAKEPARTQAVLGTRATYCTAPRQDDGRVDVDRLVAELVELHANTYSFCIHTHATDWDDFKLILARANEQGIRIWGSVVPPSETPPRVPMFPEPFRLDYERWAVEFAKLSLQYTNLVAWSIDDFTHNLKVYQPAYVEKMLTGARRINPKLAFVPCCYYSSFNPNFAADYAGLLDGVLFPYRHESGGSNLKDASLIEPEIQKIKTLMGSTMPVVLDIYATRHSKLGATTPEYVEQAMMAGRRSADGVMIYTHQNPQKNPEKFQVVKRQFGDWSKAGK